jgi:hypothetical protein
MTRRLPSALAEKPPAPPEIDSASAWVISPSVSTTTTSPLPRFRNEPTTMSKFTPFRVTRQVSSVTALPARSTTKAAGVAPAVSAPAGATASVGAKLPATRLGHQEAGALGRGQRSRRPAWR